MVKGNVEFINSCKYTRKAFGKSFINYLRPVYFNSMPYLHKKKCLLYQKKKS